MQIPINDCHPKQTVTFRACGCACAGLAESCEAANMPCQATAINVQRNGWRLDALMIGEARMNKAHINVGLHHVCQGILSS